MSTKQTPAEAAPASSLIQQLWATHGIRLLKFAAVSMVGVVLGQSLLFLFHSVLGWRAGVANFFAVVLSTIPSYLLNRAWVWGKTGSHTGTEVTVFWAMAMLGLVLSTVATSWVDSRYDSALLVQFANLASFGVLWFAKYLVLDKYLFGADAQTDQPPHEGA